MASIQHPQWEPTLGGMPHTLGRTWPLPSGMVLLAEKKGYGQQRLSFCLQTA